MKDQEIIHYISARYIKIKKSIQNGTYTPNTDFVIDSDAEFIKNVDRIVFALPYEYDLIIRNDFLKDRKPKWWTKYFTKSTYYRKKARAIKEFVDCFKY